MLLALQQPVVQLPQDQRCEHGDVLGRIEQPHEAEKSIEKRRPQRAHVERSAVVIVARR